MSATEKSEEEILSFLQKIFGARDVERNPPVEGKRADFRIKSLDTYVEVHAIKDIASDQIEILSKEEIKLQSKNRRFTVPLTTFSFRENGKRILDRIASKLLRECTQLPKGKRSLIVTKTEGLFLSPDRVIDAIIGEPRARVLSGRLTGDVVSKAAKVGLPLVASLAAAIDSGIALVKDVNLTLIGFVRGKRMNVYTSPERILRGEGD